MLCWSPSVVNLHFIFARFCDWGLTFSYFVGLLPVIGELKYCGKILDDTAPLYYDDQLGSEQKCVDIIIAGMHLNYLSIE